VALLCLRRRAALAPAHSTDRMVEPDADRPPSFPASLKPE
jgi:hypothetical protein